MTKLIVSAGLLGIMIVSGTPIAGQTVVEIDHERRTAELVSGKERSPLRLGQQARVPASQPVTVKVINTNTALYGYTFTKEAVDVPELKQLQSFLAGLKPYLPIAISRYKAVATQPCTQEHFEFNRIKKGEIDKLEGAKLLKAVLALVVDPNRVGLGSIWVVHDEILDRLRDLEQERPVGTVANEIQTNVGAWFVQDQKNGRYLRFGAVSEIPVYLDNLRDSNPEFQNKISAASDYLTDLNALVNLALDLKPDCLGSTSPSDKSERPDPYDRYYILIQQNLKRSFGSRDLNDLASLESTAIAKPVDTTIATAITVEGAALNLLNASDTWESLDPIEISFKKGYKIKVSVASKKPPELARLADRRPLTFEATLLPDLAVSPAVGLSLLYSPDSIFDTFGTKDVEGGKEVVVTGTQNSSVSYGLTLGLTYRGFHAWGESGMKWAVWLPEINLNPSDSDRAVAVGLAFSWKLLKVGIGKIWTRHTVLDGGELGDLPTGGTLATSESFGSGEYYFSLSIVGWQPFVN